MLKNTELFLQKKSRKLVKQWEIITYQPKTFDTFDVKSDITELSKTSHKLSKTIRQAGKVSSFYSSSKAEIIIMKLTLKMCLNQSILQL